MENKTRLGSHRMHKKGFGMLSFLRQVGLLEQNLAEKSFFVVLLYARVFGAFQKKLKTIQAI